MRLHRWERDPNFRLHLGTLLTVIAMAVAVVVGVVLWLFTTAAI